MFPAVDEGSSSSDVLKGSFSAVTDDWEQETQGEAYSTPAITDEEEQEKQGEASAAPPAVAAAAAAAP